MKNRNDNLISIILPCYNAEKYIQETIQSILRQTYQNFEIIVVDDDSTDHSVAMVQEISDERLHVISNRGKKCAADARNTGLEEANGRYIAFLDSDDIWKEDKLAHTLQFMQEKDAAFVFTGYEFGDEDGKGMGKIVHVPECLDYEMALSRTVIFTSTVLFDLTKISKEQIKMPLVKSEDTATWWKILKQGYLAYGLDENLVIYRRVGGSLSSNKLEAVRRIWNLYRLQGDMSFFKKIKCFFGWAFGAVYRRL